MTNEELVVLYQQGDRQALNQLVENNQKFIYKVVNKFYTERINAIDKDDLIQEGNIGFIMACSKYDLTYINKTKFITYAYYWIYRKIYRFIETRNTSEEYSLNVPVGSEENTETMEFIESDRNSIIELEDRMYIKELRKELEGVMNQYNTLHEREILKLYYGWDSEETSIEDIADILETSSSNIRKTKSKAFRKIRSSMWFRAEYNRRYREDISFERVLRNIDLGIGVNI